MDGWKSSTFPYSFLGTTPWNGNEATAITASPFLHLTICKSENGAHIYYGRGDVLFCLPSAKHLHIVLSLNRHPTLLQPCHYCNNHISKAKLLAYRKHKNFHWGLIFVGKRHPQKWNPQKFVHEELATVTTLGCSHPRKSSPSKIGPTNNVTTKISTFTFIYSTYVSSCTINWRKNSKLKFQRKILS